MDFEKSVITLLSKLSQLSPGFGQVALLQRCAVLLSEQKKQQAPLLEIIDQCIHPANAIVLIANSNFLSIEDKKKSIQSWLEKASENEWADIWKHTESYLGNIDPNWAWQLISDQVQSPEAIIHHNFGFSIDCFIPLEKLFAKPLEELVDPNHFYIKQLKADRYARAAIKKNGTVPIPENLKSDTPVALAFSSFEAASYLAGLSATKLDQAIKFAKEMLLYMDADDVQEALNILGQQAKSKKETNKLLEAYQECNDLILKPRWLLCYTYSKAKVSDDFYKTEVSTLINQGHKGVSEENYPSFALPLLQIVLKKNINQLIPKLMKHFLTPLGVLANEVLFEMDYKDAIDSKLLPALLTHINQVSAPLADTDIYYSEFDWSFLDNDFEKQKEMMKTAIELSFVLGTKIRNGYLPNLLN